MSGDTEAQSCPGAFLSSVFGFFFWPSAAVATRVPEVRAVGEARADEEVRASTAVAGRHPGAAVRKAVEVGRKAVEVGRKGEALARRAAVPIRAQAVDRSTWKRAVAMPIPRGRPRSTVPQPTLPSTATRARRRMPVSTLPWSEMRPRKERMSVPTLPAHRCTNAIPRADRTRCVARTEASLPAACRRKHRDAKCRI